LKRLHSVARISLAGLAPVFWMGLSSLGAQAPAVAVNTAAQAVNPQAVNSDPVNPRASLEARALLAYIHAISGHHTLSGQHSYPATISHYSDRALALTGKYPAVFGQDFGFQAGEDKDSVLARPAIIEEIKRQHQSGSIITLTWHAVRPIEDEPGTFLKNVQGKLTDYEWNELLTPGTPLHKRWCDQVDVVAGYLKQLRDARVPVLWRPYHEMNGHWFWWGGRKGKNGSSALYRQMYERFTQVHHLDNLIWVWNVNAPNGGAAGPLADYYPGADVADMLSIDVYDSFKPAYYQETLKLANGKPIALGEVGPTPTPEVLKAQPGWTYFMTWSNFLEDGSPLDVVRRTYHDPIVLTRDDASVKAAMAKVRASALAPTFTPVCPDATAEAKALLGRLYKPSSQTGAVLPLDAADAFEVEAVKRQAGSGAIVSLAWRAPNPGAEGGGTSASRGPLTDFEWNELLQDGSPLNQRWAAQVDAVAARLKALQDAGIAVLWNPYPLTSAKADWWAGRKGIHGSARLYQMLFDRLVKQHHLTNLVWAWGAAPLQNAGSAEVGTIYDYFPGLLYVDAVVFSPSQPWDASPAREWSRLGGGKPVGLAQDAVRLDAEAMKAWPWAWIQNGAGHQK